jgi:hypothetical protein
MKLLLFHPLSWPQPCSCSEESLEEFYCLPDEATDVPREGSLLEATPAPVPVFLPAPVPVAVPGDSSTAEAAPGPALVAVPVLAPPPVPVPVPVPAPDESSHEEAASVPVPAPPPAPWSRPVVEPPSWPTFNDSHEEFFKFKNDLSSFLNDFCADLKEESKVMLIKAKCLSPKTVKEVKLLSTVKEILDWLHERYFFPILIVEKLMQPLREKFGVKPIDGTVVAEVLELYEYLYSILYQIREQRLWNIFSPDPEFLRKITAFLPRGEYIQWYEFKRLCPERLNLARLEGFVKSN